MSNNNTNMQKDDSSSTQEPQIVVRHNHNHVLAIVLGLNFPVDGGYNKSGPLPATKEAIDAMPRITVEDGGKDCAICLEEIGAGCAIGEMPCKHWYHSGCIEKWLGIHGSCPVCGTLCLYMRMGRVGDQDFGLEAGSGLKISGAIRLVGLLVNIETWYY